MEYFVVSFVVSFVVMALAALGIGIGLMLGGPAPSAGCGRDPVSGACPLCGPTRSPGA